MLIVGDKVESYWEDLNGIGFWWNSVIMKVNKRGYRVKFDGYDKEWNMTLRKTFVRRRRSAAVSCGDDVSDDNEPSSDSSGRNLFINFTCCKFYAIFFIV